jgi:hypothetical protein
MNKKHNTHSNRFPKKYSFPKQTKTNLRNH